jgi:lipoate-protein ligase A
VQLHHLPFRVSDAAGNMAVDFLLLQRYPHDDAARFRHYGWRRPSSSFGYAQKLAFVRAHLPTDETLDLVRRASGGGIVDHRDDWTYALVVPRAHPLFDRPGPHIYHVVHDALAAALHACGADVVLQREPPETAPGVCFERPELDDIVRADDGRKVAGAALKRNKRGVLLQGSIARTVAGADTVAWDDLEDAVADCFARALECECARPGWPEFDPEEEEALVAQYADPEWTGLR